MNSCVSKVIVQYQECGNYDLKYENCGYSNINWTHVIFADFVIIGNNPRMTAREIKTEWAHGVKES
jgi:hypothetical protein